MAWYTTGTISVTNGSATVTGSGTQFITGAQVGEGLLENGQLYEIQSIESATSLTLAKTYLGATQSGLNYEIVPTQSLVADLANNVSSLIGDFQSVVDNAGAGKFNDGTVATPGISFTQDQNNGLYRIGSDNWGMVAGGVKVVDVTPTGIDVTGTATMGELKVGGTTAPVAKVDITGNSDSVPALKIGSNDAYGHFFYDSSATGDLVIKRGEGGSQSESMRLDRANGNATFSGTATMDGLVVNSGGTAFTPLAYDGLVVQNGDATGIRIIDDGDGDGNGGHSGLGNDNGNLRVNAAGTMVFATGLAVTDELYSGGTERMRIDGASGNVGIGVSNPSAFDAGARKLVVGDTTVASQGITIAADTNSVIYFADGTSGAEAYMGSVVYNHANNDMTFRTNGFNSAMVIDSSQNVLVGKTEDGISLAGHVLFESGASYHIRNGGFASFFNRTGSSGELLRFAQDGTTVGSIGTGSGVIQIGQGNANLKFSNAADAIVPSNSSGSNNDNALDLGSSAARFNDIYATNGTIQTSDAREKTEVREFTDSEMRVAKKLSKNIGFFQWLASVKEKGDYARLHCGQTVQSVIAEFEAEGLDAFDYAMICYNEWDAETVEHPAVEAVEAIDAVYDEEGELISEAIEAVEAADAWTETTQEAGDRYSLRTDQLNHFMVKGLAQAQEELEARLYALEA